ncbi:MAG: mechanosensitive ion channel family protein [Dehalococcoidia bacterium]|nr:mechanosensitive ion channel family protein [Dehalococcoidia bacterium]
MYDWFMVSGIRILTVVAVSAVVYVVLRRSMKRLVKGAVSRRMAGEFEEEITKRIDTLSSLLIAICGVVITFGAILTVLPEVGVNITAMLTGLGVGGLAVAFGAQDLIKDVVSGLFILLEDQYRVGDVVSIAGVSGLVQEMGLRRTVIRDLDGIVHSVPNGKVGVSGNFTKGFSRVNLNVSVGYGENLGRVIEVVNRLCREMAEEPQWKGDLISTPKVLRVDNLGDSGIEIKILGETRPLRQWDVMGELRLRIKNTFDEEGIEIPWPHTKVYFGNTPPSA